MTITQLSQLDLNGIYVVVQGEPVRSVRFPNMNFIINFE